MYAIDQKIKLKFYEIVDSFLVEAKNQDGEDRSLKQLNGDRHLCVDNLVQLFTKIIQEAMIEERKSYKQEGGYEYLDDKDDGYNEARKELIENFNKLGIKIK